MQHLTFLGATGTVTGSRFLLETGGMKLLVDCGLFQGLKEHRLKNWDPFPIPPSEISDVFLTHAHLDHTGYLPRFCREGFRGAIHCTPATADLCGIMLRDSARLQEEDAYWANKKGYSKHHPALPLYTMEDAERSLAHFKSFFYGRDLALNGEVRVKFKDAGHILGSSFVDIKISRKNATRRLLFSGDLGRPASLFLREPVQVFEVDYLIIESTYGNRLHDDGNPSANLARIINESMDRGGVLVVPSFAVGRTQELLFCIRELEEAGKIPAVPIYVDSPMAIEATRISEKRVADYSMRARLLEMTGTSIFKTRSITYCEDREQSKALNRIASRAIIISASGMVEGGRILHHLEYRLPNAKDTVLFIGFQGEGTRGRTILDRRERTVKIHGQRIPINARIENFSGFSAHADYSEILAWLMGFNRPPLRTFIVHGEPEAAASLAQKIRSTFGWEVTIPQFGERFELP